MTGKLAASLLTVTACSGVLGIDETLPASIDPDHDGFADDRDDNCPGVTNADQLDSNEDGVGDACSTFCTGACKDPTTCSCADFTDGVVVPEGWSSSTGCGAGMQVTQTVSASPPTSLQMYLPPSAMADDLGCPHAVLQRGGFPTQQRHITSEFSWRIPALTPGTDYYTFDLSDVRISTWGAVILDQRYDPASPPAKWYVHTILKNGTESFELPAPPVVDPLVWTRVKLDVVFANTPTGIIRVSYDGQVVFERTDVITEDPSVGGQATLVANVGIGKIVGLSPSASVVFDDLIVNVE